jgi:hypothetical protein
MLRIAGTDPKPSGMCWNSSSMSPRAAVRLTRRRPIPVPRTWRLSSRTSTRRMPILQHAVWNFVPPPVKIEEGRNKGGFAVYLRDPDGITLEFLQSPPLSVE